MQFPATRREFLKRTFFGASALAAYPLGRTQSHSPAAGPGSLIELTATEAVALLRSGELSCEKYAASLLEQCRKQRALNAIIWQDEEMVMEAARAADKKRAAKKLGTLHGLPILVKDNFDTARAPTTGGTPALRNHRPRADAPVVASLFSAGAILLGKANMHEMAFGITSNNAAFGAVHNPYNPALIPGGSSGGTAAAVAARMCPAGLGTDTGGSVRTPSALCGIAGLRPTTGRYPAKGIIPLSHTRDTPGPMARSVADLALLDSVITGQSAPLHPTTLRGLRLGVPRGFFYENMDSTLAPVIENALTALRVAGCVLVEAEIPDLGKLFSESLPIAYYEMRVDLSRYLEESGEKMNIQELVSQIASPDVKAAYEIYVIGPKAPTRQEYETALRVSRPALQAAYRDYFRAHDVAAIVYPTTLLPARPIGEDDEVELNGKKVSTFAIFTHNDRPNTTAAIPGLSLPVGLTASGLPVGLEIDAPQGADRDLLRLGMAMEAIFGRFPPPPGDAV